ncbi:MAG: hypothetical protein U0031_20705 [Thermomicrobiales bacterium]
MKERQSWPRLLLVALALAVVVPELVAAQGEAWPDVRGSLYENPSFGWILVAPEPDWTIVGAESADGVNLVHLVSALGDGADDYFVTMVDDGSGAMGCVQDLVDNLSASFPEASLQGWHEPDVTFSAFGPDEHAAYARAVLGGDPGLDRLGYLHCKRNAGGVIIGEALLRTARDLDDEPQLPLLAPLWPGVGHTGRSRTERAASGDAASGVVRFIDRYTDEFPFSCVRQEELTWPVDSPPPDRGWFGCDGRIVNVDTVPATIDLAQVMLGCYQAHVPAAAPPDCAAELVRPTAYELVQGPPGVSGPVLTLAPGEFADVALWYALPEGDVPWHVLFVSPDRIVQAGPTFFTQGTGSRPRIRIAR